MKAFPDRYFTKYSEHVVHEGMDLRDYFAIKIFTKLLPSDFDKMDIEKLANVAYFLADILCKERNKK